MRMRTTMFAAVLGPSLCWSAMAQTALGPAFTYQGRLHGADGPHDLRFRLWDAATAGNAVGPHLCFDNVMVSDGLLSVPLDFGSVFNGEERYLEIEVREGSAGDCDELAGFTLLGPRQRLSAAPHASFALDAGALRARPVSSVAPTANQVLKWNGAAWAPGADAGLQLPFSGTSTAISAFQVTNQGSGTDSSALCGITGSATAAVRGQHNGAGGGGYGVWASHAGAGTGLFATTFGGTAVYGAANGMAGPNFGGVFEAWGSFGRGVFGQAYAETGTNFGGYFFSLGNTGRGVYGGAESVTGVNYGVWGQSASTSGRAVFGQAFASTGATFGGRFEVASPSGVGVLGLNTASSGAAVGIYGQSDSASGRALFGLATTTSGDAVGAYATSNSTAGRGVVGWATATSGATYGVWGRAESPTGFAVFAEGRLGASGTKSFCIDHPDDPEARYLLHYSSESPEVINFYSGNATLDDAGGARIELPPYFARLNQDPRYQLTPIGAPMPGLHVAEEIDAAVLASAAGAPIERPGPTCSFRVAGGVPGGRVSWRVEAVRSDAWVRTHGAPVEIAKQAAVSGGGPGASRFAAPIDSEAPAYRLTEADHAADRMSDDGQ
jgi:hypothetical protein